MHHHFSINKKNKCKITNKLTILHNKGIILRIFYQHTLFLVIKSQYTISHIHKSQYILFSNKMCFCHNSSANTMGGGVYFSWIPHLHWADAFKNREGPPIRWADVCKRVFFYSLN